MVEWSQVAALTGASVAVIYPPLGLIYRALGNMNHRITVLEKNDVIDVRDLETFEADVGRRLKRIEDHIWK